MPKAFKDLPKEEQHRMILERIAENRRRIQDLKGVDFDDVRVKTEWTDEELLAFKRRFG